ncbi:hypothetical protein GGF38_000260 [Coemansia sp. RSA 25]|nr:hypothetical protein GGF38_000260 [Coemansia sp. RSA 25]
MLWRVARLPCRFVKTAVLGEGSALLRFTGLIKSKARTTRTLVPTPTVLKWHISVGSIVEAGPPPSSGRFGPSSLLARALARLDDDSPKVTMLDALTALEMAANDPRITDLDVRVVPAPGTRNLPVSIGLGFAQTHELRNAVLIFNRKKAEQYAPGDWSSSFAIDSFDDQLTYYFASAFNTISVQPLGKLPLTGLAWDQLYFKDLLDKIGIDVQTGTRMAYGSACATYTESVIPEKHQENSVSVLHSLYQTFMDGIVDARVSSIAASIPEDPDVDPRDLVAANLHSALIACGPSFDAVRSVEAGLITDNNYSDLENDRSARRNHTGIDAYIKVRRRENEREVQVSSIFHPILDKLTQVIRGQAISNMSKLLRAYRQTDQVTVGIVYLLGDIERGGENGARTISKALAEAAQDPEVHSIVLRVDSSGGDLVASDTIYAAVERTRQKYGKPIIASYGNTAASGTYYATSSCEQIFASPATLTGGIGVSAMRLSVTQRILDFFDFSCTGFSATGPASNLHELEGNKLVAYTSLIGVGYTVMTGRVGLGRNMSSEDVESVAQGRVFTGAQAAENKLVDHLGGFTCAIEVAAQCGHEVRARSLQAMFVCYLAQAVSSAQLKLAVKAVPVLKDGKYQLTELEAQIMPEVKAYFTDELIQDVLEGRYLDKIADSAHKYQADITKNIRIKEFSAPAEGKNALLSLIIKQVGGDLLSKAVTGALHREGERIMSSISTMQQPRAKADIPNLK